MPSTLCKQSMHKYTYSISSTKKTNYSPKEKNGQKVIVLWQNINTQNTGEMQVNDEGFIKLCWK